MTALLSSAAKDVAESIIKDAVEELHNLKDDEVDKNGVPKVKRNTTI